MDSRVRFHMMQSITWAVWNMNLCITYKYNLHLVFFSAKFASCFANLIKSWLSMYLHMHTSCICMQIISVEAYGACGDGELGGSLQSTKCDASFACEMDIENPVFQTQLPKQHTHVIMQIQIWKTPVWQHFKIDV